MLAKGSGNLCRISAFIISAKASFVYAFSNSPYCISDMRKSDYFKDSTLLFTQFFISFDALKVRYSSLGFIFQSVWHTLLSTANLSIICIIKPFSSAPAISATTTTTTSIIIAHIFQPPSARASRRMRSKKSANRHSSSH